MSSVEKPSLVFQKPDFSYEELEQQLLEYVQNPEGYKHDGPSVLSIREAIKAGRLGNVAVGGCLLHHEKLIAQNSNKTLAPHHRTDLHAEMVLLNELEESLKDNPKPQMRNYTMFTSQEPCPMCLARICFNQVGKTYYVYRDDSSPEAGEQSNWDRLPPGFRGLGSRLIIEEADCSPKLKEISKQVWMNSIGSGIKEYLNRY